MLAIETKNLTKEFNGLKAVDSINLEIAKGELFGLLGPNGAGKTTTISMLCTILKPTSGDARVWEHDIKKEKNSVRNSIGIVFQDPSLDEKLTGYENMDFHGRLYRVPRGVREDRINELLELVELGNKKKDLVETYSGGMKRRLEIARGLLHQPKVLFLDEPTLGLDPQTRRHIWEYIKRLNDEQDVTMVLTTHYMDEADYLCNRVAIMDHGKIVALDAPEKLKDTIGGDVISIEIQQPEKIEAKLCKMEWVKKCKVHDSFVDLSVDNSERRAPEVIEIAQEMGAKIKTIRMREPTLEDVFLHYTGKTMRENEAKPIDRMRLRRKAMRR